MQYIIALKDALKTMHEARLGGSAACGRSSCRPTLIVICVTTPNRPLLPMNGATSVVVCTFPSPSTKVRLVTILPKVLDLVRDEPCAAAMYHIATNTHAHTHTNKHTAQFLAAIPYCLCPCLRMHVHGHTIIRTCQLHVCYSQVRVYMHVRMHVGGLCQSNHTYLSASCLLQLG